MVPLENSARVPQAWAPFVLEQRACSGNNCVMW